METMFSDYKTVKETALEWGITTRQIVILINAERIPGALKTGNLWLIPKDAVKPADRRRKDTLKPLGTKDAQMAEESKT